MSNEQDEFTLTLIGGMQQNLSTPLCGFFAGCDTTKGLLTSEQKKTLTGKHGTCNPKDGSTVSYPVDVLSTAIWTCVERESASSHCILQGRPSLSQMKRS